MYKTIRHGENSLQYTILPQNDDFRMEGKLTSVSSSGYIGNLKSKRFARRRSFFAYLGLLFVCAVIIGAILVPFLVSAECLPNLSKWFLRTKDAFAGSANRFGVRSSLKTTTTTNTKTTTDVSKYNKLIQSTIQPNLIVSSSTVVTQISDPQIETGETSDAAALVITETSMPTEILEQQIGKTFVTDVKFEDLGGQVSAAATPRIVVTTVKNVDQSKAIILEGRISPTPTTAILSTVSSTLSSASTFSSITGRFMQVPLLKSASKKPIIPPVLAETKSFKREKVRISLRDEEKKKHNQNKPNNWIRSHWPYIHALNFFQWTGYKADGSVLFPGILGAILIVTIIITLLFIARNKRTIVSSVRKRKRNDIEEAGEDNTTLLTNSCISDDE